jgi:hypothetical protein
MASGIPGRVWDANGTRSDNAGCGCDACREASRLALARQRNAKWYEPGSPSFEDSVAPSEGSGISWAVVAVVSLGYWGYVLWKGPTLRRDEDVDQNAYRRTRRR